MACDFRNRTWGEEEVVALASFGNSWIHDIVTTAIALSAERGTFSTVEIIML